MDISVDEKDIAPVAGMKSHPANFGRLCVKGSALHDTLDQTDVLRVRPASHRRLLRRQQVDEGLYRQCEYGYQFASVYGVGRSLL